MAQWEGIYTIEGTGLYQTTKETQGWTPQHFSTLLKGGLVRTILQCF